MPNRLSTFLELGPLHGPLAAISSLSRDSSIEKGMLRWLGRPYVRSRYGVSMRSNWADATFNLCYFGHYGRTLSDLLGKRSQPFVFLDIGANQGLYSLIAGKNPNCRQAIAFEPVPATFALLEANIAANGLDNVKPVNQAIAAESGTTIIRMPPEHSGGASMAADNGVAGLEIAIETIRQEEMDALIADGPEPILVKIDVEGFEPVVVAELVKSRHIDRIAAVFYEMDENWADPMALERMLRDVGFTSFRKIQTAAEATHYDVLATR
ncbi:MAG: FkbM family methyltransferase [Sphingomonadales bacterium]|nr:FkbM family methyltransferase [Sphingomonadales bacterium]